MRHHLIKCFQKKEMMPFPQSKNGDHHNFFPGKEIELHCTCQMPETYDDMIECDTCEDWYHLKCVGLKKFPLEHGLEPTPTALATPPQPRPRPWPRPHGLGHAPRPWPRPHGLDNAPTALARPHGHCHAPTVFVTPPRPWSRPHGLGHDPMALATSQPFGHDPTALATPPRLGHAPTVLATA